MVSRTMSRWICTVNTLPHARMVEARCVFNQDTTAKLIHNCWYKNQQSTLGQLSISANTWNALKDSLYGVQ